MNDNEIAIAPLGDDQHTLHTVAGWLFGQWGHLEAGRTLEGTIQRLRERAGRTEPPLTLIALHRGEPVGTASLTPWDMKTRPELAPWLSSVFVEPAWRGAGIGTRLVRAVEARARELELPTIYLFTPDRKSFYVRLGWEALERCEYRGESVVLMCRLLK